MKMMDKVYHNDMVRKAYINELRRKDGKYNFVFVPIYLNKYKLKIESIMINGQVVGVNYTDLLMLSLKPGRYSLRVVLQIDCDLLSDVVMDLEKQNPGVKFFGYRDRYRHEVESVCDFRVNENDTAYV